MKKAVAFLASLSVISMTASSAFAQSDGAADETVQDGIYVRAGAGIGFARDWSQGFTYNPDATFLVAPATGQSIDLDEGLVAAFAIGFDYADGIRTELEYRYASSGIVSATLDDPMLGPVPAVTVNDDIIGQFLMANFYFDFANKSALTPFIGGGVGGALVENENAQRDAALAYQARAGISLAMGDNWSADLEYGYLRTNKLVFGIDDDEFEPGGPVGPSINGERYRSSSVMMSLRKQF